MVVEGIHAFAFVLKWRIELSCYMHADPEVKRWLVFYVSGVVYVSEPTVWECSIVGF